MSICENDRLGRTGEVGPGVENVDVENRGGASKDLTKTDPGGRGPGWLGRTVSDRVDTVSPGEKDGTLAVELLRDDDELALSKDTSGTHDRVEGAESREVERYVPSGNTESNECIPHGGRLVVRVVSVVAADQKMLDASVAVELRSRLDASRKEEVFATVWKRRARAEHEAHGDLRWRVGDRVEAIGRRRLDPLVARKQASDAKACAHRSG